MRNRFVASLGLVLVAGYGALSIAACGDSGTGGTGSGGGSSTSTGSGPGNCTVLTPTKFQRFSYDPNGSTTSPFGVFVFDSGVSLGTSTPDSNELHFYKGDVTGVVDFANETDFSTCTTCLLVSEDLDSVNMTHGAFYLATSGTLDLGTTTLPAISGKFTDVKLVEVDIDANTGKTTPVADGKCLYIGSASFAFDPAPSGWTCNPGFYADKYACDCASCGVDDPDCSDTTLMSPNCEMGQACVSGVCSGAPSTWTCAPNKYDGGAGDGCDCNCGAHDPDCDLTGETVVGCQTGEQCSYNGVCVPTSWTCDTLYFGGADGCDCGCGAVDPDCADATKASCNFCDQMGSCDTVTCSDPMSKIDPTNNAVCQ